MTLPEAILLGLIQGVTEFLPISSSAHLILLPFILGWQDHSLHFDIVTNAGTLLAAVIYFWPSTTGSPPSPANPR